jgi:uncharacterized heparinase superfamily protein
LFDVGLNLPVRSFQEILFRLRQEVGNLAMLVAPPQLRSAGAPPVGKSTTSAAPEIAESILLHRFPLLGVTIDTGPEIDWRRDYLHGISTSTAYFRRVPYLDFARVGDHKVIWELNRHQHLPLMVGKREYLDEAFRQLDSWLDANPFLRGINWASALEVAFRALSWARFWQLAGAEMSEGLRGRFLTSLYRHGRVLELNLSVYFSPNTHLLGEAVALHALGVWFPEWPRAARWRDAGGRLVEQAMQRQVCEDGSHFEQSLYYHVYALDFFLLHRSLAKCSAAYEERLQRMAEFLHAVMGPARVLPLIGDDDGGRLAHPYGDRTTFGRGTLAQFAGSAEWPHRSRLFADAGIAVMVAGDVHVVVKAGGFGEGSGGHSHSDVLSLVVRVGDRELLIDPGTYTYISDPMERDRFRGSAAHNTLRIDGGDQAVPAGPFRWNEKPEVKVLEFAATAGRDTLEALCSYAGFTHRRRFVFQKPGSLKITDTVEGPPGEHTIEQFWHLGTADEARRIHTRAKAKPVDGWRSRVLASREKAPVLRVEVRSTLPVTLETTIDCSVG